MSDSELESESDDEEQMSRDLEKLNAALNSDNAINTPEHREEYEKLDTAYKLNRKYDDQLRQFEKLLRLRFDQCHKRIKELEEENKKKTRDKEKRFRYVICGRPYFKDKSKFPAPDNEDTILIRQSQMYDFSIIKSVTGWRDKEKSMLLNVLLEMSREKKKMELNSKIAAVRRENKGRKISSTNENTISTLKHEIDMVEQMGLNDLALPLDEEYDWDLVANKMSYRHDAMEYKAFWKLYLHPTINKTPWSTSEHTLLLNVASDQNLQNWKEIASLLGTGRTSFQCFVYFRTHVRHPYAGRKWTNEEEEYLKRIVKYYRADDYIPWGKVAIAMDNRTKIQVYNKYFRLMEFRKGRFLKEEDEVILTYNDKFGANFKKMAKFIPGRSSAQCRNRFQILIKKSVSTVWSTAEDRKLINFLSNQTSSVNYSGIAQHFPDKDRQHIRSRCITLRKWMRFNPNTDIANAPRRASRNLNHGVSSHDLTSAVEKLKIRVDALVDEMKKKTINMDSSEGEVDETIKVLLSQENDEEIEEAKCHDLLLSDGSEGDQHPLQFNKLNVRNLRKCLTLWRACLDKNKFLACPLTEKCIGLLEPDQDLLPVIKVKSYSRKKPETILKVGSAPDIWGSKCLPPRTYVFPPNYSTIIALRTMMSSISTQSEKKEEPLNIITAFKNALPFNTDEHDLFKERFNNLFFWPMLLTYQLPEGYEQNLPKKSRFAIEDNNSVALLKPKTEDEEVHSAIDLEESASTSTANLDLEMLFESSSFESKKF